MALRDACSDDVKAMAVQIRDLAIADGFEITDRWYHAVLTQIYFEHGLEPQSCSQRAASKLREFKGSEPEFLAACLKAYNLNIEDVVPQPAATKQPTFAQDIPRPQGLKLEHLEARRSWASECASSEANDTARPQSDVVCDPANVDADAILATMPKVWIEVLGPWLQRQSLSCAAQFKADMQSLLEAEVAKKKTGGVSKMMVAISVKRVLQSTVGHDGVTAQWENVAWRNARNGRKSNDSRQSHSAKFRGRKGPQPTQAVATKNSK